jgi:NADPH:quinone reductase-like Zn-dependent oxidoreductase
VKAITQREYGPPMQVLTLDDVPEPAVGDGEVLVDVHAAGVNALDWHLVTGVPSLVRIAGNGLRRPKRSGVGRDLAGTVAAVGGSVTRFKPGDEVFGVGLGTFAEQVATKEDNLVHKPAAVSFVDAAAVPIAAVTALQGLRDRGNLQPGQRVLITGASGGVGTFAVQLAKAEGAEVTAVCSTRNQTLARTIGADHAIDYSQGPVVHGGEDYDLIVDIAGRPPLRATRRALNASGTLVTLGGEGGRVLGPLPRMARAFLLFRVGGRSVRFLDAKVTRSVLDEVAGALEAGHLTPVIDRTFPLASAPEAVRYLEEGHTQGKVVVEI